MRSFAIVIVFTCIFVGLNTIVVVVVVVVVSLIRLRILTLIILILIAAARSSRNDSRTDTVRADRQSNGSRWVTGGGNETDG